MKLVLAPCVRSRVSWDSRRCGRTIRCEVPRGSRPPARSTAHVRCRPRR